MNNINYTSYLIITNKKSADYQRFFVGCERFELTTPALSRRCSKPTELTSREGAKILKLLKFRVQADIFNRWTSGQADKFHINLSTVRNF
jgi:hypothetical protein